MKTKHQSTAIIRTKWSNRYVSTPQIIKWYTEKWFVYLSMYLYGLLHLLHINICVYTHVYRQTHTSDQFSSVHFSRSVVSDSLRPHELQHTRPPCPSPTPGVHSTHVHWVGDAIQPSHPLSSPSPPVPNPSQHQSLFQWVNSSHEVAKVLELQL